MFFFLGINAPGVDPADAEPNHSPRFTVDEAALGIGVRALAQLAVDTLTGALGPESAADPTPDSGSGSP